MATVKRGGVNHAAQAQISSDAVRAAVYEAERDFGGPLINLDAQAGRDARGSVKCLLRPIRKRDRIRLGAMRKLGRELAFTLIQAAPVVREFSTGSAALETRQDQIVYHGTAIIRDMVEQVGVMHPLTMEFLEHVLRFAAVGCRSDNLSEWRAALDRREAEFDAEMALMAPRLEDENRKMRSAASKKGWETRRKKARTVQLGSLVSRLRAA